VTIDRELLVRPAAQQTTLGHALNLLAGAAVRFRESFGRSDPVWSLIGFFAVGRLLAAPRPRRCAAEIRVPPGPATSCATRHHADETRVTHAG